SLTAVTTQGARATFLAMNHGTLQLGANSLAAVAAGCLVYFAINTGSVATIISLCSKMKPFHVWKQSFLWTGPSYFGGAGVSTLAMLLFHSHTGAVVLFGAPVIYLTFYSYKIYVARADENLRHIEQLSGLYVSTVKSLALAI